MKFALHGFATIVLACATFSCAAPVEGPSDGTDQEDQGRFDSGNGQSGPGIHPQYMAAPTSCNSAQLSFAQQDCTSKHGMALVTDCSYNSSTGYVAYNYEYLSPAFP